MWSIAFPGCRKSALTSSSCCAINWSSTNSTSTDTETICPKSGTGLGPTRNFASVQTQLLLALVRGRGCPILARFLRKGGIPREHRARDFAFDFDLELAFEWRRDPLVEMADAICEITSS